MHNVGKISPPPPPTHTQILVNNQLCTESDEFTLQGDFNVEMKAIRTTDIV